MFHNWWKNERQHGRHEEWSKIRHGRFDDKANTRNDSYGGNIVEETHDENKININRDFIDFNVGLKNHHIPKMDMRKFDGKDPVTWIL